MKSPASSLRFVVPALAGLLTFSHLPQAVAGTSTATPADAVAEPTASEKSTFDEIWSLATLYKDPGNPWLEEVRLFGRFHGNWSDENTDKGGWNGLEARRVRAGLDIKFLEEFELKGEWRFIPFPGGPVAGQRALTEASLSWSPDPAFRITVGKQLPAYTQEGLISSNDLLTVERSNLANTFWVGEDNFSTGLTLSGEVGAWQYYGGVFSGELDEYFSKFDAGYYWVAGLGYDFKKQLGVDRALLRFDYVYNDGDPRNLTTKPFTNSEDLDFELKDGRYGVNGTVIRGSGLRAQPDVWGFEFTPTFDITKKLQLVARYTFLNSDGPGGIKAQRRYENLVPDITGAKGDQYQAVYLGLNYYIYGNKLKLQTGIEYSNLHDSTGKGGSFNAWSYQAGFRFSF